jgi:DNA-binding MarR family transcriptional regulator
MAAKYLGQYIDCTVRSGAGRCMISSSGPPNRARKGAFFLARTPTRGTIRPMPSSTASPARPRKRARTKADSAMFVLRKLRLVFNTVKGHFREVEKKTGVAGAQVWAMSVVRDQPGIGVNDLARAMDIHQSTASNLIKPLIESGMLVAERAQADRRALKLRVTARGTAILRKAPSPETGLLPAALAKLDQATLMRLDEDLEGLVTLLHPDKRAAKVPLGQ